MDGYPREGIFRIFMESRQARIFRGFGKESTGMFFEMRNTNDISDVKKNDLKNGCTTVEKK